MMTRFERQAVANRLLEIERLLVTLFDNHGRALKQFDAEAIFMAGVPGWWRVELRSRNI